MKAKLLEHIASQTKKRYVTCFLGGESYELPEPIRNRVKGTKTLHAAILEAIRTIGGTGQVGAEKLFEIPPTDLIAQADRIAKDLRPNQKYLRGLYTGGTLAYETLVILDRMLGRVYSNAPLDSRAKTQRFEP